MQSQSIVKWTCQIMKQISGTKKFRIDSFPKEVKIEETEITKPYEIANGLNKFFTRLGPTLASSITKTSKSLKDYLVTSENKLEFYELKSLKNLNH